MMIRPLAVLLLLSLALPAFSAGFPACVRKRKGRYQEPATLGALVRCQQILRDKHIALQKKRGYPLSIADQEALDDFQREEVRNYLSRHPGRASMEEGPNAAARKGKKKKKGAENPEPPGEDAPPPDGKAPAAVPTEGAAEAPAPEVIRGMVENLRMQLGDRPDLQDLASAIEMDGATLSPWTLRKLKAVARQAKTEGTDLNLSPEAERWLLSD